jgi:hypothetical protein
VPYIAYFVCINVGGVIADAIRARKLLSTLNVRRLAMIVGRCCGAINYNYSHYFIALGCQALFLVICGHSESPVLVILFLTLGVGLSGFQYAGWVVNYMDIAPAYAGTLFGIGNTISCIAGFSAPSVMGFMTADVSYIVLLNLQVNTCV